MNTFISAHENVVCKRRLGYILIGLFMIGAMLPAGRYCVKATYLGGKQPHWSKGIPFVVEKRRRIIFLKKRVSSPKKITIQ